MRSSLAPVSVVILCLVTSAPAVAHRLDEYLQATFVSLEKDQAKLDVVLTPGLAVLPWVLTDLDEDADSVFSEAEQRAYADRFSGDLTLTLNDRRLALRLASMDFTRVEDMREGRGGIHLEFTADLPPIAAGRTLRLENHHKKSIAVYQVNCLTSQSPEIVIGEQHRNPSQSVYEVAYTQDGGESAAPGSPLPWIIGTCVALGMLGWWLWVR